MTHMVSVQRWGENRGHSHTTGSVGATTLAEIQYSAHTRARARAHKHTGWLHLKSADVVPILCLFVRQLVSAIDMTSTMQTGC